MILRRFLLACLITGLTACASVPQFSKKALNEAEDLFMHGKYNEAARLFTVLSGQASPNIKTELRLRAAAAMARSNLIAQARQTLADVSVNNRNRHQVFLYHLTLGHLAIAERTPEDIFIHLRQRPPSKTKRLYSAEYYKLRADAHTMLGKRLDTARELVKREIYLRNQDLKDQNQRAIWDALATLPTRDLQQYRTTPPPNTLSGWMHLVQIAKSYQLDPDKLKSEVRRWKRSYPKHPVDDDILSGLATRSISDVRHPKHIALILPLSSKYATAAEAVRDGFLAAYYSTTGHKVESIKVYDIGDDPSNVTDTYDKAISEGAQFVVGPLDKESVTRLKNEEPLPIPTLALNYAIEANESPTNLFQFGLSPEEEARQVAERTWLDGHVHAAVVVPNGPWGERVHHAFKERWELMGGQIVTNQSYDANLHDFSEPLKIMLDIDKSKLRYRKLSTTLKKSMKYTPRRRKDIDFIFLAAFPKQARAIRPQLKFFHATEIPVYSTSHIFTGNLNQEKDRDMDGMLFGDMPWVLAETTAHRSLRTDIERHITSAGNSFQRLYALGIDAFSILGALGPLRSYSYERYDGETGSLSLDEQQRIRRQLTWVRFRSGQPASLDRQ
ncbi:MAG: penicillin-binding protein activator [Gammaproteobacteria bacterium]|nr:penicillin-binding protein activator [Gammaproteobacteria bacterium]